MRLNLLLIITCWLPLNAAVAPNTMPHIQLTIAALVLAPLGTLLAAKPNNILFYLDDLGHTDLGCSIGENAPTPNLDRRTTTSPWS